MKAICRSLGMMAVFCLMLLSGNMMLVADCPNNTINVNQSCAPPMTGGHPSNCPNYGVDHCKGKMMMQSYPSSQYTMENPGTSSAVKNYVEATLCYTYARCTWDGKKCEGSTGWEVQPVRKTRSCITGEIVPQPEPPADPE